MSKADTLARALDGLLAASPEVEAAAVVSADGLPMASALPGHVEEDRLAAMSAALLTLGDRASDGLGKGALAQVFIEGEHGHVILMSAGQDAVLVGVVAKGAKIGLVLYEIRKTAAAVASAMDAPVDEYQSADHAPVDEYQSSMPPSPAGSGVRPPEPVPAAEVVQPTVNAWE